MSVDFLKVAAAINFVAAALHIAIIFGGANWYRFFGAGEHMASMAEQGSLTPTIITLGIALVLSVWGICALSAAGVVYALPLVKWLVVLIAAVYLFRGAVGLIAPFVPPLAQHPMVIANSASFWVWSSLICLAIGVIHAKGIAEHWS